MGKLNEGHTQFPVEVEQSKTQTESGEVEERGTTNVVDEAPSRTWLSVWINFGVIAFFALMAVVVWMLTFGSRGG